MIARETLALLVLVLCGACSRPQSSAMVSAAPAQQTERFANGDVYVGQMSDGVREGQGIYIWADGRRYEGSFRAGLEEGQGTYSYPNGDKYEGQFQASRRTGQGTYSWSDGRKYVGQFQNNQPNGRGTYSWPDGRQYVGEFKNGAAEGHGSYTWPDGRKYVGELRDDRPNGHGTFTLADGRQQSGLFRNGEYVGGAGGSLTPASTALPAIGVNPNGAEIPLQRRGGTYLVSAEINGQPATDFHIDSGAADVSVSASMFQQMKTAGSIRDEDMLGSETYTLANGSRIRALTFRIRSLKVGTIEVQNVRASVSQYAGPPLIGMSFLGRFNSWSVDNGRRVLILR